MSGIVEDLRDEVTALKEALVKLCAKSGHADEESWQRCEIFRHCTDLKTREPRPEYVTDTSHAMRCSICGEFACLHGGEELRK